jgi:hypothetical protein
MTKSVAFFERSYLTFNEHINYNGIILRPYLPLTLYAPMSDLVRRYDFPVPYAFPHVVRALANG